MDRFKGRTVLVTGAARGMGAAHARAFAREGANVVVADVLEDAGTELARELGDQGLFVPVDVTSETDWQRAVDAAEERFGPIDVLVNNAGIGGEPYELLEDTSLGKWQRVLDVNLTGTYLGIRAVTPSMRTAGGGAIVNISSVAGITGVPLIGPYVASKWGVRGLTKVAAVELARDDIRVNSVHPGMIRTPMTTEPEEGVAFIDLYPTEGLAIPRAADPEEITRLVLFVASDDASFSTGGEFVADGGALLGPALQPEVERAAA